MDTITLGGQSVSRIGLGTWAIGAAEWANVDHADSIATIRAGLEQGINLIDTAPIYGGGRSEEVIGEAIVQHQAAGGQRENFYIATKFGLDRVPFEDRTRVVTDSRPQRIVQELEDSLRRLRTEYIDLYQMHWPDPLASMEDVATEMLPLLQSGKVRALGVSNFSVAQMKAFRSIAPIVSNQPPYNIYERGVESETLPYCDANGVATLAYSALCRSMLSGRITAESTFTDIRRFDPKFVPPRLEQYATATAALDVFAQKNYGKRVLHLAIRWILDRSPHTVALWGAHRPAHLEPVAQCFGWKLNAAAMQAIDAIVAEYVKDPVGPEYLTPGTREA